MELKKLYILLSEGEERIENDVDMLIKKKILSEEEISSPDVVLVCISRDYLEVPNPTSAIRIRDQLSNVFCPKWRMSSIQYTSLLPIMNLEGGKIPEVYVMTSNKEIYEDLDYYLHLTRFSNRMKMFIDPTTKTKGKSMFVPIQSQIKRDDVLDLGKASVKILEMSGYGPEDNEDSFNGPIPGWIFQCANPWLTRVLDLYEISPIISMTGHGNEPWLEDLRISKEDFVNRLENPVIISDPKIGEDIRTSIVESFRVRKDLYKFSKDLLDRIA